MQSKKHYYGWLLTGCLSLVAGGAQAEHHWLKQPMHLASKPETEGAARSLPEWEEFAEGVPPTQWRQKFDSDLAGKPATLRLHQYDLKQVWRVSINQVAVGDLLRDENPMWVHFELPASLLKPTGNEIVIEPAKAARQRDDIRLRDVTIVTGNRKALLNQATLSVQVKNQHGEALPCRLTITDRNGSLVETGAASNQNLAVRPGVIYCLSGEAEIPLPAGDYHVYAGRGFEYSLAKETRKVAAGETAELSFTIKREVDTAGYVACDTHVHTLTHSGHGDSTVEERMITLAGEGIELPIATDHNVNIDHRPFAKKLGADRYFTPVIGNEVTTRWGHFNVFPFAADSVPPNHQGDDWESIFKAIYGQPKVRVVVLNHARDVHGGFRPFGPTAFNDVVGENLQGWKLQATAMEVVNSSATQTDPLQLLRDWMTMLNAGHSLAPIGCSDSHDVARHFVGQARTYVRCDDRDVSELDVDMAVANLAAGRVRVSYGLLVEMTIANRWSSGELARVAGVHPIPVRIRVQAPHWLQADRVSLYANGKPVFTVKIDGADRPQPGVIYDRVHSVVAPKHDVVWTAIATGPGIEQVYWRSAKPYQPTSPRWRSQVIGCSGAVWLDVDGDGRRQSARDYATQALVASPEKLSPELFEALAPYDTATAAQAAYLLDQAGVTVRSDRALELMSEAPQHVRDGFRQYVNAWRLSQRSQNR